ncbi:MAG TPA: hypothetical protein VFI24_26740 [Pyrinomonadaceae bacterium]|nr:hypothetical protein [Pyrinomonadaceae bacterium]
MLDESTNPQGSEPPTNTGGGGNEPLSDTTESSTASRQSEPPTNTGGGGGSSD